MIGTIWQYLSNSFWRRRYGLDRADIQHLRADLRFRLAVVEYAYFGRSGRRVAMALAELRALLGDKAIHRYLKSLDPDLRTQFVERFQGAKRRHGEAAASPRRSELANAVRNTVDAGESTRISLQTSLDRVAMQASNVVPIKQAAIKAAGRPGAADSQAQPKPDAGRSDSSSMDAGD